MGALIPRGGAMLTDQQELFCMAYVTNGGNATAAAEAAGYAHPRVQGSKQLTKHHIAGRIRQLVALDITSKLGQLVAMLWEIASNEKTPPRERINAINSLLDRGGLAVPKGQGAAPSVAVQVNVASTAADAQAAIKEIWNSRTARQKALDTAGHDAGHEPDTPASEQVIDSQS